MGHVFQLRQDLPHNFRIFVSLNVYELSFETFLTLMIVGVIFDATEPQPSKLITKNNSLLITIIIY